MSEGDISSAGALRRLDSFQTKTLSDPRTANRFLIDMGRVMDDPDVFRSFQSSKMGAKILDFLVKSGAQIGDTYTGMGKSNLGLEMQELTSRAMGAKSGRGPTTLAEELDTMARGGLPATAKPIAVGFEASSGPGQVFDPAQLQGKTPVQAMLLIGKMYGAMARDIAVAENGFGGPNGKTGMSLWGFSQTIEQNGEEGLGKMTPKQMLKLFDSAGDAGKEAQGAFAKLALPKITGALSSVLGTIKSTSLNLAKSITSEILEER